jgi:uncharacterized protein
MRTLLLIVLMGLTIMTANAQSGPAGDWLGTLNAGGASLRIVFHIEIAGGGGFTSSLDSPDQGAFGIPVNQTTYEAGVLTLALPPLGAAFEGRLDETGATLEGTWSQGGGSLPLVLERTEAVPVLNRPQEPRAPFPYRSEEVSIITPATGVTLAGTLTLPEGNGPHPAVILISGSGSQNRDEELMGHKPFLVLADYLTRQGIAVLRYDDRGVGGSTGDFGAATSIDFAGDARAAVGFLAGHPAIDSGAIGLIGHSEGGLIAPMVAVDEPRVAFIVMLAGPGLRGDEILMLQSEAILRASSVDAGVITKTGAFNRAIYDLVLEEKDPSRLSERLGAFYDRQLETLTEAERAAMGLSAEARDPLIAQMASPWMRTFITYDPAPTLARLTIPTLSLIGANDLQVPATPNTDAIEAAFRLGGNTRGKTVILPGLNHLFQTSTTGAPSEYSQIEETMAPAALEIVSTWINQTIGR